MNRFGSFLFSDASNRYLFNFWNHGSFFVCIIINISWIRENSLINELYQMIIKEKNENDMWWDRNQSFSLSKAIYAKVLLAGSHDEVMLQRIFFCTGKESHSLPPHPFPIGFCFYYNVENQFKILLFWHEKLSLNDENFTAPESRESPRGFPLYCKILTYTYVHWVLFFKLW